MLETLRHIVQEVNAATDLNKALKTMVHRVNSSLETEVCSVYLLDRQTSRYVLRATEGLDTSGISNVSLAMREGLIGLVGERSKPLNLDDAPAHPHYRHFPSLRETPFKAFLGVPIIHHRKPLGVLAVQQRQKRRFDNETEAFLVTLSAQLAGIIAHAEAVNFLHGTDRTGEVRTNVHFDGIPGAPGIGMGIAVLVSEPADLDAVPEHHLAAEAIDTELALFDRALEKVRADIHKLGETLAHALQPEERALFNAYLSILDTNALGGEVAKSIREGNWAQGALSHVARQYIAHFENLEDSYLRERATDIRQLSQRLLACMQETEQVKTDYPQQTILMAQDLSASMLTDIPPERLAGMVSVNGSANSHMAIMARAMNIPTVMGAVDLPFLKLDGCELAVDGFTGKICARPSPTVRRHYHGIIARQKELLEDLEALRELPCVTPDDHQVQLWVNIGLSAEIDQSIAQGAEGIGLYRTEMTFLTQDRFPTEEEQCILYRKHLEKIAPRPVTMRTLDIGGDKELPYFPISEANPFLGWRGIRVTLDHPEIMIVQLRSMLKAHSGLGGKLRIMLPMISDISEVEEAVKLLERCEQEVRDEGFKISPPEIGAMIEVPAAVYLTGKIAERVDFLAVGSNDLTQYILAIDRNNPRVARFYRDMHPAVLSALGEVAAAGYAANKPVSICGELAGNPAAAILLMAMGYDSLSMNSTSLLKVKSAIRSVSLKQAKDLLRQAMNMESSEAIRDLMHTALCQAGLSRILQPVQ